MIKSPQVVASRSHSIRAVLLVMLLGLAACSSSDSNSTSDTTAPESASTDEESSATTGESDESETNESDEPEESETESTEATTDDPPAIEPGTTLRLLTHGSFSVSDGLFDNFTLDTGIDVEVVRGGDAGEMVAKAALTSGSPDGDVMFGIDNTFLQRGLDADLFVPHESPMLSTVPAELQLDPENRVTPIDYGDVCINYWIDGFAAGEVPTSLDDLTDPAVASQFVTEDPQTSSPGFAFLLATIATYGEDGWEDYWQKLADGGVAVTPGWSEAYYGEYAAGGGERSLVTSYATSPVADVLFAEEPIETSPSGVITEGCFRQVEFAGVLRGTESPDAAGLLIDFMLSEKFQADIPLNMFVFPANQNVAVPEKFSKHAVTVENPVSMSLEDIEANRARWTDRWVEIVLR